MDDQFSLSAYSYDLPQELIAQYPVSKRDESRLMVLDADRAEIAHMQFSDFPDLLHPGDCVVMNNSRVFPARLHGRRKTGGKVEIFLLHYPVKSGDGWLARALTRSSKPLRQGEVISIGDNLQLEVVERLENGSTEVKLYTPGGIEAAFKKYGRMPLPPYIRRKDKDPEDVSRYQTVYASETGSVAAPTAGLHFTDSVIARMKKRGINLAHITLHVGYGTFAPVRTPDIRDHGIHSEYVVVPEETCNIVNHAREQGGRIVAVGTTSVRSLEWASSSEGKLIHREGECSLYIMPGFEFRIVDCMLTNFHLPGSSLLILVSAFAGREQILYAYRKAIRERYRFYSYGDAMFISTKLNAEGSKCKNTKG